MTLKFHTPHPPASEEQVRSIETRIGKALPADYRAFLLTLGGGYRPDPGIFDVPGEGESFWHGVLGFAEGTYDIRRQLHPQSEYLPYCLPIGHDICGNYLLLGLHEGHFGRVYWEDHELTEDGEQRPPVKLADTFAEFVQTLRPRDLVLTNEAGLRRSEPPMSLVEQVVRELNEGEGNSFCCLRSPDGSYVQTLRGSNGMHLEWRVMAGKSAAGTETGAGYSHYRASYPGAAQKASELRKADFVSSGEHRDLLHLEDVLVAFESFVRGEGQPALFDWRPIDI